MTTPPVEFAAWLGCLAFGVMLFNQLAKAKGSLMGEKLRTEVSPQPLMVQAVAECVKERECGERDRSIDGRLTALEGAREKDKESASTSRKALYDQIDTVRKDLSQKIDDMPAQIISILRNTGAIK